MLESLLHILDGQHPDKLVWTAHIEPWLTSAHARGTGDPVWKTEGGFLKFHQHLGILPYRREATFLGASAEYSSPVAQTWDEENNQRIDRFHTRRGILTQVSTTNSLGQRTISKYFVETPDDLKTFLGLLESRTFALTNLDTWQDRAKRFAAADGLPAIGLPRSPVSALIHEWCGGEHYHYLLAKHRVDMETAMVLMAVQEEPVLDALCQLAPPLVHFDDGLGTAATAPIYDQYIRDHYTHRLERLHAANCKVAVQLNGSLRSLLPRLAATGVDVLHGISPAPSGECSVEEVAALCGNSPVLLWGGIPGAMFSPPYTWAELKVHLLRTMEAWRHRPFILAAGDPLQPDADVERCRRISELVCH